MAKIKFEDGTVVNFNGDPTENDVNEIASKLNLGKTGVEPQSVKQEEPGYMQSLVSSAEKRADTVGGILASKQSPFSKAAQVFGQGAGLGADIIGGGISRIASAVGSKIPEFIEKPVKELAKPVKELASSAVSSDQILVFNICINNCLRDKILSQFFLKSILANSKNDF